VPAAILGDAQLGDFTLGDLEDETVAGPSQMTVTVEHPVRLAVSHAASSSSMTVGVA
jgi:hypothetical protein